MNARNEMVALQDRSDTLCVQTIKTLIFYIWNKRDCLDFVRDWSRIIIPGIGHDDFWPVGSTISGDVLFVEKEMDLFLMLHDELDLFFLSMPLDEFLRRLMDKQEDLEECLFEGGVDSSDERYQFAKSAAYTDAVAELRAEMDKSTEQNSFRMPEMSRAEMTEILKKCQIVSLFGNSDP